MEWQLRLLDPPGDDWVLDDETRRVGRTGVAAAREALRAARRQRDHDEQARPTAA